MKFKQVLIVDSKDIAVLTEAMRLYKAHVEKIYQSGNCGDIGKERYGRYRCKVNSVATVLEAVNVAPKPVISEASEFTAQVPT